MAPIRELLGHPRVLWVVVLWACILAAPTLDAGLVGDDFAQAEFLTASREGTTTARWWDMFVLVDGAQALELRAAGRIPWWSDPQLRVEFFRPLSVATHQLDHRLYPEQPWLMHVHGVLWYALACGLAWAVARRFCSTPAAAGVAALVYASAFGHMIPAGWLAHRNALVVTVFSLLTILAHDRWRRDGDAKAGAGAAIALTLALLSGEAGIVALGFVLAHAVVFDPSPWRRRILAMAPSVVIVMGWRLLHVGLGYGVVGSGAYIDPLGDVQGFLAAFPRRYGQLATLSVSPPFVPDAPMVVWWIATALLLLAAAAFLASVPNRAARFGALAVVLGIVPLTTSVPFERLLVTTSFGAALLWGELLDAWLLSGPVGVVRRAAAILVVAVHLVISPAAFVWRGAALEQLQPTGEALGGHEWMAGAPTIVIVHTPNYLSCDELARVLPSGSRLWVLHGGFEPPIVERIDGQTLELRSEQGWPGDPVTEFWRSPVRRPFVVGERIETDGYVAIVQEVEAGRATRVHFRFPRPIDDPSVRWVFWRDGMHRVTNPRIWR